MNYKEYRDFIYIRGHNFIGKMAQPNFLTAVILESEGIKFLSFHKLGSWKTLNNDFLGNGNLWGEFSFKSFETLCLVLREISCDGAGALCKTKTVLKDERGKEPFYVFHFVNSRSSMLFESLRGCTLCLMCIMGIFRV